MNFDSLLSFFKCYIYTSLLFKSFKFCGLCYLLSAYILVFQEVCILGFSQGSWLCDGVSDLLWKLDHVQFFFFSVERKVCFIFSAGNRAGNEGGGHLSKDILTLTDNQWARAFIGRGRGLHSESAQSALTVIFLFFLFFFNFYFFIFYLWWILSYIEMKQPWVYMCSPSQSPLPPPSPPVPSRFSQCTRSECLSHASNLGWWSVSP